MKRIYIVRHGETEWNLRGKTQGIKDSKLTQLGRQQGGLLASRLLDENIGVIYSSMLKRASSTAKIINKKLKLPLYYNVNLNEINFGLWEGLTNNQIIKKYPKEFQLWREAPQKVRIPNGEELSTAQKRIVAFVDLLIEDCNINRILLVSHSSIIKLLLLNILGMNLSGYYRLKIENASLNIIEFRHYGPLLLNYNDTYHIKYHN